MKKVYFIWRNNIQSAVITDEDKYMFYGYFHRDNIRYNIQIDKQTNILFVYLRENVEHLLEAKYITENSYQKLMGMTKENTFFRFGNSHKLIKVIKYNSFFDVIIRTFEVNEHEEIIADNKQISFENYMMLPNFACDTFVEVTLDDVYDFASKRDLKEADFI